MTERRGGLSGLRREHPVFFWGTLTVVALLLGASAVVAMRVPEYRREAALLDQRMSETEKETRDRILDSRTRRSQLAVALLQRELRLKVLEEERAHLAISIDDGTMAFRHGPATLREVPVQVGSDTTIRAPDGRTWRLVRPVGERRLAEKLSNAEYTIPEWVYVARGEAVPPEGERRLEGGLGRYVLRLNDGTEIYTTPESGPFAQGVKPAAFAVSESDMRAIFDALKLDTPVYIY